MWYKIFKASWKLVAARFRTVYNVIKNNIICIKSVEPRHTLITYNGRYSFSYDHPRQLKNCRRRFVYSKEVDSKRYSLLAWDSKKFRLECKTRGSEAAHLAQVIARNNLHNNNDAILVTRSWQPSTYFNLGHTYTYPASNRIIGRATIEHAAQLKRRPFTCRMNEGLCINFLISEMTLNANGHLVA